MTLPARLEYFARPLEQRTSAFVSDFDGTLAPIVNDPATAAPLPESLSALRTLSEHLGLVAVVSGRPVEFLREKIPIDDVVLIGQYGLERLVDGRVELDPRAVEYVGAVARAAAQAEERWPALRIERKGEIAFTVHWRTAPNDEPDPDDLSALAVEHGLAMQPGRKACELRPPVPVDKGTVFQGLAYRYESKAFAGDDSGDLAAFAQEFGDVDRTPQAVRIAVRSTEAPPELLELAHVIVDGPAGLAALLTELADAVSARRQP
ncbi:MAG: trehalose-phosphatase [Acidimicrobiia bacterium]